MPDYSNTVIYKIQHREKPELLYVGCTTNFNARRHQHRCRVSNVGDKEYNAYKYRMIRENGGFDMFEMKPVKIISCKNKLEAEIEEERTRQELKATLNCVIKPIPIESKPVPKKDASKLFLNIKTKQYSVDDLEDKEEFLASLNKTSVISEINVSNVST
jgi:hypothetical protein